MSQTKAQLIEPVGVVTASGIVVSGVATAASFDGDIVGSASSVIQGTNLNLGAFNASSFVGDFTGNATGIITSSAIKVGSLTASSFVGDFTGTATSMARGTGFKAGTVTATPANVTYTVTVGSKTGGGNAYYLDGIEAPTPSLYPGATYTFDQSAGTNATHPLRFATAADAAGSTEYTFQVTTNGTPGSAGAWTKIVVSPSAPDTLYYYCTNHSGMGDSINITNLLQGPVTGAVTGDVKGNIAGNITGNVTGNAVGAAGSVLSGSNIHVGVMTATSFYGDGSNLTGIAATNFNTQTVTIGSTTTSIDLSAGNVITLDQQTSTIVSLANTSEAMDVTVIRPGGGGSYNISYSTGGVDFDGDDTLTLAASSDFTFDGDFTVEGWFYCDSHSSHDCIWGLGRYSGASPNDGVLFYWSSNGILNFYAFGGDLITGPQIPLNAWTHIAIVRSGAIVTMYVNGNAEGSATKSDDFGSGSNNTFNIGSGLNSSSTNVDFFDGKISNFRVVKGTAVYTSSFVPPSAALTNIDNTVLLCCQDTSSTTVGAVKPGSITAVGDPTAGAQTVALSGTYLTQGTITWPSRITWDGGSAPNWADQSVGAEWNQLQLLTRDSGVTWYGWQNAEVQYSLKYDAYSTGDDERGQLGQNTDNIKKSSPTQVPGGWADAFGCNRQWLLSAGNGALWSVGKNARGSAGTNDSSITSYSSPIQIGGDTTWSLYNKGSSGNVMAVTKTDGTFWVWGDNNAGELGLGVAGDAGSISSPAQLPGTWQTTRDSIGRGQQGSNIGAIKADGTLWTWGRNEFGELGHNQKSSTRAGYSSPTQVGTDTTWAKVYAGDNSMYAVKTNGTAWAWGRNHKGMLGLNQPDNAHKSSPTQVGTNTTWASYKRNGGCGTGIKTDGTLWVWGSGYYGALGLNESGSPNVYYRSPKQVPGTTWSYVDGAANGANVALKTDGTIWGWGYNSDSGNAGQLGQNNIQNYSSPTQIGTGTDWQHIAGGYGAVWALRTVGT